MTPQTYNTLIGSISILLWGTILPIVRLISEEMNGFVIGLYVHGGAALFGLCYFRAVGSLPSLRPLLRNKIFLLRAFLFTSNLGCLYYGVSTVSREHFPLIILINYLWPTVTLLWSVWLTGVCVHRRGTFFLGILTVIGSMAFELLREVEWGMNSEANRSDLLAYAVTAVVPVLWGLYSAVTKRWGEESGGSTVTPYFSACVAVMSFAAAWIFTDGTLMPPLNLMPTVLFAGSISFVAYFCWDVGVRKGRIVTLSLLADFIPWLSLLSTRLFLDIPISLWTAVSAAFLVLGALITRCATLARS